jgi:hypothetical protein
VEHDPQTYYPDLALRGKADDAVRGSNMAADRRQDGPGRYEMRAPPAPTTATILA